MKHDGNRVYNTGDEWPASGIIKVPNDPFFRSAGWNLIGVYQCPVAAADIQTIPPGCLSSPIYGYSTGYQIVDTLFPGYAYWVKLSCSAQIVLPPCGAARQSKLTKYIKEDWGKIIIDDATGRSYTLYAINGQVDLSLYELPPAPMAGMFDIRFSSGRIAEDLNRAIQTIDMSGITYPLTVRVEGMDIRLQDETGKTINVNLKSGEDVVISDASIMKLMVTGELVPAQYSLEQNYPNPFNPTTKIEFSLPVVSEVKLTIYNLLGQEIVRLIEGERNAGTHSVQWNVSDANGARLSSGIYFYELKAEGMNGNNFQQIKKMILLK
jgi:hypothetical protein